MEISVTSFIHIMNLILEQIEITIPNNLLLARIREQAADFFVPTNIWVEDLRLWKSFKKAKKGTNIVIRIYFQILGQIVDL